MQPDRLGITTFKIAIRRYLVNTYDINLRLNLDTAQTIKIIKPIYRVCAKTCYKVFIHHVDRHRWTMHKEEKLTAGKEWKKCSLKHSKVITVPSSCRSASTAFSRLTTNSSTYWYRNFLRARHSRAFCRLSSMRFAASMFSGLRPRFLPFGGRPETFCTVSIIISTVSACNTTKSQTTSKYF